MTEKSTTKHGGRRDGAGRKPGPTSSSNERYTLARARKEEALAELRTMEAAVRARQLIPAAEVEQALSVMHARVAQSLLSLPDQLERTVGLPPDAAELVERTIHANMEALADDLASLTGPEEQR